MISGFPPFTDRDGQEMETFANILKGQIEFRPREHSSHARALISGFCQVKVTARLGYLKGGAEDVAAVDSAMKEAMERAATSFDANDAEANNAFAGVNGAAYTLWPKHKVGLDLTGAAVQETNEAMRSDLDPAALRKLVSDAETARIAKLGGGDRGGGADGPWDGTNGDIDRGPLCRFCSNYTEDPGYVPGSETCKCRRFN